MIDALVADGVIARPDGLRALCGFVTFSIDCSSRDADQIMASGDQPVIFCQLESTDETLVLAGFADEERRQLYLALRAVNGIGRASALKVLDCGEVRDTLRAAAGADGDYFRAVPGLGAKRITAVIASLCKRFDGALPRALPIPVAVWVEARDALVSGGTDQTAAELSLQRVLDAGQLPGDASDLLAASRALQ